MPTLERSTLNEKQEAQYIGIDDASIELGVSRTTMYYYLRQFSIEPHKFPLDRRTYITTADLERIRSAKKAAAERSH